MIVVAGDDHHLGSSGQRAAQCREHRLGHSQRVPYGAVPELEYVTQQHEAIDVAELRRK
jgi:hypothetical protein